MPVFFHSLPTDEVRALQAGGPDAHGHAPERTVSDGVGAPCRHCLRHIPQGAGMLILAHCPFPVPQPYAETGPIFLCADACKAWDPARGVPPILQTAPDCLVKGYGPDDRIVYGTGRIAPAGRIVHDCEEIFGEPRVAYIHIRSARNNCYQASAVPGGRVRVERCSGCTPLTGHDADCAPPWRRPQPVVGFAVLPSRIECRVLHSGPSRLHCPPERWERAASRFVDC